MKIGIILLVGLIILSKIISAVYLSDQGTNVQNVTSGQLVSLGNLTITIYDSQTGGNLLYNQTFTNAIINGSWNVMIAPSLEFGEYYWKGYNINGEDLNFSATSQRVQFQSPMGLINNASFLNLTLISNNIGNWSSNYSVSGPYLNWSQALNGTLATWAEVMNGTVSGGNKLGNCN